MNRFFTCMLLTAVFSAQAVIGQVYDTAKVTVPPPVRQKHWSPYQLIVPAGLIGYGVLSLHNGALKDLNEHVKDEIWTRHPHGTTSIDNYLQWAPALAVYGLNLAGVKGKNNLADRSIMFGMSMLIATASTQAAKSIAKEWRPDGSNNKSFPSGHTTTAFAAAEFMRREYKEVSAWYGISAYTVAAATAYLRMYNNKHWLGDVVAGAGAGILSTDIAYWVYPSIKKWLFKKNPKTTTMILPAYDNAGWKIGLVHTF